MPWRVPRRDWYRKRFDFFKQWIADDIAQFMAWRLPLRDKRGRRARALMRRRVLRYMRDNPGVSRQEAIDDVTTDILNRIEAGEEVDYAFKVMVSP